MMSGRMDGPADADAGAASPPITGAQLSVAAATFDLLSVPGRLHIVGLLLGGERDVTSLASATGASIPAASQQLAKLRAAGIVSARRAGRRQLYRVEDPHIVALLATIFEHIAPDGSIVQEHGPSR